MQRDIQYTAEDLMDLIYESENQKRLIEKLEKIGIVIPTQENSNDPVVLVTSEKGIKTVTVLNRETLGDKYEEFVAIYEKELMKLNDRELDR